MSPARLAVLALLAGGCAARDLEELAIACTSDDECPSDAWCDVPHGACRSHADSGPPQIEMDGIVRGDSVPATMFSVPSNRYTSARLILRNTGGSTARTEAKLGGPACLHASGSRTVTIDPGERIESDVSFDPDPGCATPARVTVDVTASGRAFAFDLEVTITP
ncbi:MAG: hypothetical protein M3680_34515 [Myxococcota bacterium]|nr:hypothetical protein [Myxococcota bacterium]